MRTLSFSLAGSAAAAIWTAVDEYRTKREDSDPFFTRLVDVAQGFATTHFTITDPYTKARHMETIRLLPSNRSLDTDWSRINSIIHRSNPPLRETPLDQVSNASLKGRPVFHYDPALSPPFLFSGPHFEIYDPDCINAIKRGNYRWDPKTDTILSGTTDPEVMNQYQAHLFRDQVRRRIEGHSSRIWAFNNDHPVLVLHDDEINNSGSLERTTDEAIELIRQKMFVLCPSLQIRTKQSPEARVEVTPILAGTTDQALCRSVRKSDIPLPPIT
ncbi:MAG: hypothetical protein S4CHLAM102_03920 [Chlamydiia bacterium]|nr:hypothetical protein [Chlamydiia bacterium]